ncbi:MAG: 2-amino-4-hydroxy-6-hydroxymethyldihydropteridine diphosphokinase [Herpetosiphon sp.]|nr:2-amino-4-hydroxy-6-hydroxymethyldihydropteridine diphosphokinase [Herpetosiphon sp.]
MPTIYLALGSNQGDRLAHLREAIVALQAFVTIEKVSSVYETAAAYVEDQPSFLNAVLRGTTQFEPQALLDQLKQIEHDSGRRAGIRYGPRPLDLDILLYDQLYVYTPTLIIPHERMHERAFVLRPLAEIAPNLVDAHDLNRAERGAILAIVAPPEALLPDHQTQGNAP